MAAAIRNQPEAIWMIVLRDFIGSRLSSEQRMLGAAGLLIEPSNCGSTATTLFRRREPKQVSRRFCSSLEIGRRMAYPSLPMGPISALIRRPGTVTGRVQRAETQRLAMW